MVEAWSPELACLGPNLGCEAPRLVTLELPNYSMPQFPHPSDGDDNTYRAVRIKVLRTVRGTS